MNPLHPGQSGDSADVTEEVGEKLARDAATLQG